MANTHDSLQAGAPRSGDPGVPRRDLLRWGGAAFVGTAALAGCDLLSTEPTSEGEGSGTAAKKGKEAPSLTKLVEAGDLPPVEERLPVQPLVVQPTDRVGVYGGEWRTAMSGRADSVWLVRTIGYEQLMTWDPGFTEVVPNVAESVDAEDDGRAYTFHLREGMKWSDGEPFTADDIVFWVDDVVGNDELPPAPLQLTAGGEPPTVEKVDDYTVRFIFAEPHGLFLEHLATVPGNWPVRLPRHYLEQFHQDYNDAVDELVEEEGVEDWVQLFLDKSNLWSNPELPRLHPWTITTPLGEGSQVVAERNPYYFKTDPDGSQLPYLDRVVYDVLTDAEVILLKATNGELNMHVWHINTPTNKPVLAEHREESNFRFFDVQFAWMNRLVISLNMTLADEQLREVFRNKDFRVGLSHAMNREEMIDAVFQRQGEPWQAAPRRESEFFDEDLAKQYTEYDPDLANEHLDRAGYTDRDDGGFRLRSDGERISFAVDVPSPAALAAFWPDAMELVRDYWREVGVDVELNLVSRELWQQRHNANEHQATIWNGDGGGRDAMLDPRYYFPFSRGSHFGKAWAYWYQGGPEPMEEPPEVPRQQQELYDQLQRTFDEDERNELFRQILQIAKEQFYCFGTVLPDEDYGIVQNGFHNVFEPMPLAWMYPTPGPTRPEQYFLD